MPLNTIRPRDVLRVAQRVEARGAIDSAHRIKQLCGQVLRFGVAMDLVERDVTADLKGALTPVPGTTKRLGCDVDLHQYQMFAA